VYATLFARNGLSAAEISSLFVIWSVTSFVLQVPTGLLADVFSRRWLLTISPLLVGAGYALWTFVPCYLSFALGFMLWGAGDALRSGTLQALVYEELARRGVPDAYTRLIGRSQAIAATAIMAATGLAAFVLSAGGYLTVGVASVVVTLFGAVVGWSLPDSRGHSEAYFQVLRAGLVQARRSPEVRHALILVSVLTGVGALDEYIPLLARSTGVSAPVVPLLVLLVTAGLTVGGWLAGRGIRWTAPVLAIAAGCLAVGAGSGRPAGMAFVAVAFGIIEWATAAADARLQENIADEARATITSIAGLGTEVVAVLIFVAYAVGSGWVGPGPLFALAAVPYLGVAVALWRGFGV
jgi:Major Facilitator Superfamily